MPSRPNLLLPLLALALLGGLYVCTRMLDTAGADSSVHGGTGEEALGGRTGLSPGGAEGMAAAEEGGSSREDVVVEPVFLDEQEAEAALEEVPEGSRLNGRVVRKGGAGLAGATVIARKAQIWLSVPADVEEMPALYRDGPVYEALTDEEGRFTLYAVEPGNIALAIRAPGFAPLTRTQLPVPKHDEYDLGSFELELGVRLSGEVMGGRGKGLEGVSVLRAVSPDGGSIRLDLPGYGIPVTTTDAEGKFEVDSQPPGNWHLIFDHPDYRVAELKGHTEPAGQTEPGLYVALEEGLSIEGRVEGLDPAADGPLRVTARRDREQPSGAADDIDGSEKFRPRHAEVRLDGSFALKGLAPGQQYRLRLYRQRAPEEGDPEGLPERWVHVRGIDDELQMAGAKQVVIEYREDASLRLVAVDAESGRPLTTFIAHVSGEGLGGAGLLKEEGAEEPTSSFPGGEALFEGLRPGDEGSSSTVRVRCEGFEDFEKKNLMIRPGDELDLGEVRLERAKRVDVRVVDKESGEPIPGAHVFLAKSAEPEGLERWIKRTKGRPWSDSTVRDGFTDAEGRASVTVWPDSICVLKASAEGYLPGEEGRSVVPHGEEVVLELDRGGHVTVRVLDDQSLPVAGMFVEHTAEADAQENQNVFYWNPDGDVEHKSNELGVVEFTNLAKGKHTFKALEKKNVWGGGGESAGHEAQDDVYLDLGESKELVLRVAARGGYEATLLQSGVPLSGALAKLTPLEGDGNENMFWIGGRQEDPRSRVSDHAGRVRFKGLKVGRYDLKISHPERRMSLHREVLIEREPRPEVIELGLATIEGRVTDRNGDPLRGVDVTVQEVGDHDWDGGDYRVRITEDDEGDAEWNYDEVKPWTIETDENGEYRLRGVRPEVELQMYFSDRYVVGGNRELHPLGPDEYLSGVDMQLERAGALRVELAGLARTDRRRVRLLLEREVDRGEGQEPGKESRSTSIRSWRPTRTVNSLRAGVWTLKLTVDGASEPFHESQVVVRESETARVQARL